MLLIPISIIIQFIFFNKIGKLYIGLALLLATYRSLISFFYTSIFTLSDLNTNFSYIVKTCNFNSDLYTNNFFFFTSPANRLYCAFPELSISALNLFYSGFAGLFLSLFISLIKDKRLFFNKGLKENSTKYNNLYNFSFLFFLFDPSLNLFTSAIGKDVIQFTFYTSLLLVILRFNFRTLIYFLINILFINYSRAYVFLFAATAFTIAYFLPSFKLSKPLIPLKPIIRLPHNIKVVYLLSFLSSIIGLFFVLYFFLGKVQIDILSIASFMDALDYFTLVPMGSFAIPEGTPWVIKYLFFWILPFPGIQTFFSSIVFGVSSIFIVYLILKIFSKGIILDKLVLKFIFVSALIFSLLFSIIGNNSGLTIRYRSTALLPSIYLLFHIASRRRIEEGSLINKN